MNFLTQKPEAFGLDISDLSLKLAKLKKVNGELNLASFGQAKIPSGVIEKGEIKNKKVLSEIIKEALKNVKGERIKSRNVICSLPEEKSFLDIIRLPQVKKEELREAVKYELENYIPLPADQVYFDCEPVEPVFDHIKYTEVLIVAAPKTLVDSYSDVLEMASLLPEAFEVECLSVVRALVSHQRSEKPLLIIDFGGTRTTFIIFSGRSIRFTSTIPISSQGLSEAISKSLNTSFKKAEQLKLKQGLVGEKEIFEAMVPTLTDLVEQIKTYLEYYHSHEKKDRLKYDGKALEKILLCGGGANLRGLDKFLSSELKISVEPGNPWVNILKPPLREVPELPFRDSLAYTTALGLALRDVNRF